MLEAFRKKWFVVFCWAGFLMTVSTGLGMFLMPGLTIKMLGITDGPGSYVFFVRMLGLVLVPFGLCYMLAYMDPDAARSLLFAVTSEKFLAAVYSIAAFFTHLAGPGIWLVIVIDGILTLVGACAVINFSRIIQTLDELEEEEKNLS